MLRLTRRLRSRSLNALGGAAMLLALVALAAAGLESVSFGHQHLAGGHAHHHHHFYFGPHEHSGTDHDHDHDHGKAPAHPRDTPRRTATVSSGSAPAQPVATGVPAIPLTEAGLAGLSLAPAPVVRPAVRLLPPRAPPTPRAVPRFLL